MIKFFKKRMNNKKGFTLIELIVVIAILGILAAIAVPRFTNIRQQAVLKAEIATATALANAARVQETNTGVQVAQTAVTATDNTARDVLDPAYMAPVDGFNIGGGGASPYTITWTTKAKGTDPTGSITYTEGTEIVVNP